VLKGELKEVKARYGKNTVQMAFDDSSNSDSSYLGSNSLIQKLEKYEGHIQIKLVPGADAQQLLRTVAERSRLNRFEVMEPSLEEIFIDVVGKTNA
jgi:ABC-2 type transport system ATP-binding protein